MSTTSRLGGDLNFYLITSIFVSTLGPFQYGLHLAELNAPQDMIICGNVSMTDEPVYPKIFNFLNCIYMTQAQFAFLSSVYVLGGFIGAILAGPASSNYGRLLGMRLSSLLFTAGSILETVSDSVLTMSIGRFLTGLGAGTATVVAPLYIFEIAPPNMRGLLGTMTQVMICLGILTTQSLAYVFNKEAQWRIIIGFGVGLGIFSSFALFFIPESPTWLAANDNLPLAKKVLQRIRGAGHTIRGEIAFWNSQSDTITEESPLLTSSTTDPAVQAEPCNLRNINSHTTPSQKGVLSLVCDPLYRPAIISLVGIMFTQQFSGINSINLYSVSLFRGVLPVSSLLLTILISTMNVIITVLCAPLPDIIGRKKCLLISIIGMGSMSLFLAISLISEIKLLTAIFVTLFVAFFAFGLGPVPFSMASELVGQEAIGAAQSWSLAGNYTATYLVAQFFPIANSWMNARWGGMGWIYFFFAGFLAMSALFVAVLVPQTKEKSKTNEAGSQFAVTDEGSIVQNSYEQ